MTERLERLTMEVAELAEDVKSIKASPTPSDGVQERRDGRE